MQLISLDDIIIPEERQRREFDETSIEELAASIISPIGLLQPIVLRDDQRTLVAGERRLRAITLLYSRGQTFTHDAQDVRPGDVPYVRLSDLSLDELRYAELEENVRRVDLTWQERARAYAALHEHLGSESFSETAKEIHGDKVNAWRVHKVAEAVRLAEFLDDPMVAAAPDEKTARRAIKDAAKWKERSERLSTFNASAANHILYNSDCFATAATDLASRRIDTIVMDPPYGIDANTKGFSFDGQLHEYDDSDAYFTAILEQLPGLAYSLTAEQAHVYCFCDIRRFSELHVAFELAGFDVWARPLIWDKGTVGSYAKIEYGPRACYDAILYANKGKKPTLHVGRDVINIPQDVNAEHPAHKPVSLYSELLKRSVLPGDIVADFFAGSGPIFAAAAENSCVAYGWEINDLYYQMALDTIRKVTE